MATTLDLAPSGHLYEGSQSPDRIQEWRQDVYDVFRVDADTTDALGDALTIPLDQPIPLRTRKILFAPVIDSDDEDVDKPRSGYKAKRRTSSRDSQRRRDALLIGKEGSRQRRRWENGELSRAITHCLRLTRL